VQGRDIRPKFPQDYRDPYQKAEQILAELARTGGGSIEAEAMLTLRALAHAMLANAAAAAIGDRGSEERAWMEAAGTRHGGSA
jgi:hypothetical protein